MTEPTPFSRTFTVAESEVETRPTVACASCAGVYQRLQDALARLDALETAHDRATRTLVAQYARQRELLAAITGASASAEAHLSRVERAATTRPGNAWPDATVTKLRERVARYQTQAATVAAELRELEAQHPDVAAHFAGGERA